MCATRPRHGQLDLVAPPEPGGPWWVVPGEAHRVGRFHSGVADRLLSLVKVLLVARGVHRPAPSYCVPATSLPRTRCLTCINISLRNGRCGVSHRQHGARGAGPLSGPERLGRRAWRAPSAHPKRTRRSVNFGGVSLGATYRSGDLPTAPSVSESRTDPGRHPGSAYSIAEAALAPRWMALSHVGGH